MQAEVRSSELRCGRARAQSDLGIAPCINHSRTELWCRQNKGEASLSAANGIDPVARCGWERNRRASARRFLTGNVDRPRVVVLYLCYNLLPCIWVVSERAAVCIRTDVQMTAISPRREFGSRRGQRHTISSTRIT